MKIRFEEYTKDNFLKVCEFLIRISKDNKKHINWNWARWE